MFLSRPWKTDQTYIYTRTDFSLFIITQQGTVNISIVFDSHGRVTNTYKFISCYTFSILSVALLFHNLILSIKSSSTGMTKQFSKHAWPCSLHCKNFHVSVIVLSRHVIRYVFHGRHFSIGTMNFQRKQRK